MIVPFILLGGITGSLLRRLIAGVQHVVVNAAGCGSSMKEYAELLRDGDRRNVVDAYRYWRRDAVAVTVVWPTRSGR